MKGKGAARRACVERVWEGSRLEGEWLAQAYEQIEPVDKGRQQQRRRMSAWFVFKEENDDVGESSSGAVRARVLGEASETAHDRQSVGEPA